MRARRDHSHPAHRRPTRPLTARSLFEGGQREATPGALLLVCLTPLMETVESWIPFVADLSSHPRSTLSFAVGVCVLLVVEPLGIPGPWLRVQRTFAACPFRY